MIQAHIDRDGTARRTVREMIRALRDLRWFWPSAAVETAKAHDEWFRSSGRGSWRPLSNMTAAYRAAGRGYYARHGRGGPHEPILMWTWGLRNSLAQAQPGADGVRRFHMAKMVYGTTNPRAAVNHYGQRKARVPARPLLDPDESLAKVVTLARRAIPAHLNSIG